MWYIWDFTNYNVFTNNFNFTLVQNQYLLVETLLWILHEILLSCLQVVLSRSTFFSLLNSHTFVVCYVTLSVNYFYNNKSSFLSVISAWKLFGRYLYVSSH